jgi:chromodomain-helicase-DNA-binding protein 1
MPSPSSHSPGIQLANGHLSPPIASIPNGEKITTHSESELSKEKDAAAEDLPSTDDHEEETYDEDAQGSPVSDSSEDVDAEGEPDGDYDSDSAPPAEDDASGADTSSSEESRRPPKRKASVEDDDYITQNPELYGLRRSVRTDVLRSFHVI